jgi:hypothetical protein
MLHAKKQSEFTAISLPTKKYKNIFNKAFVPSNKHLAQLQQENLISTKAHAQNF